MSEAPTPTPTPPLPAGQVLLAGVVFHGLLSLAALLWLHWRGRSEALAESAIGPRGLWPSALAGLVAGLLSAALLGRASRRWQPLRTLDATARETFAGFGDRAALAFVLVAAIGEELFFRLAVFDCCGLAGSVAIHVLVHSSIGGLRLLPYLCLHALMQGGLVQAGFGLLGSTVANAVLNHLNLRRILCR